MFALNSSDVHLPGLTRAQMCTLVFSLDVLFHAQMVLIVHICAHSCDSKVHADAHVSPCWHIIIMIHTVVHNYAFIVMLPMLAQRCTCVCFCAHSSTLTCTLKCARFCKCVHISAYPFTELHIEFPKNI